MKKRILALFTMLTILSCFSINIVIATSASSSGDTEETASGEQGPLVPNTSGDKSGDVSGEASGDVSGEKVTAVAYDEDLKIEVNTILKSEFRASSTVEDSTLTYIVVTQPTHGTLVHSEATSKEFTYTPDLDYVGTDSFTFQVNDGTSVSNIATISITMTTPTGEIIPFYYVDMQSHWANYSASHLAARGLIVGEEIGNRYYFYPNREMTRSDFMLFLLAITESNTDADVKDVNVKFADADSTPNWLIEAAKLAYAKGIIKGSSTANGTELYLNAYNPLTRKEAAVMLNNVLELSESKDNLTYNDANDIPAWAVQAVKNLTAYKIIQGNSSNEFKPNRVISKAEAAEMCYKLVKELEKENMPNVSGDDIK